MAITGVQEIALIDAFKNILRDMLGSDDRAVIDPRDVNYNVSKARRQINDHYLRWAAGHAEVSLSPEEHITYLDRFMRQMPSLLDDTVTADNIAASTD